MKTITQSNYINNLFLTFKKFSFDRDATHRDVPCKVYSRLVNLVNGHAVSMKVEIFVPTSGVQFHNVKTTYFSAKVTTFDVSNLNTKTTNENEAIGHKLGIYRASFIIDYYNIDSFDGDSERFKLIEEDFNLPLASGCSEFVQKFQPYVPKQSFIMNYYQITTGEYIMMAYDHSNGFLRKELPGKLVNVWDLNEDLLYHINLNLLNSLHSSILYPGNIETCSVLKVTDEKLSPAFRPFNIVGQSLNVLLLMGANSISYIGKGHVRDMPCYIYETIVEEPPIIFSLTEQHLSYKKHSDSKVDYIVQFYNLKSVDGSPDQSFNNEESMALAVKEFWPAKIKLYVRFFKQQQQAIIKRLDELDVYDFYASLEGNYKKSIELFMAPECFQSDNNEELKMELAINFPKVHSLSASESDRKLLSYNRYKLESFLISDLINLFQFSRMHLIDYEMKLLPHHVDLKLTFNNRYELKTLVHYGEGNLPSEDAYKSNRFELAGQSEQDCILFSSLFEDISMVVYCPDGVKKTTDKNANSISSCISVYGENEPIIKNQLANEQTNEPLCQVYRFIPTESPLKGPNSNTMAWNKFGLKQHVFNNFEATLPPSNNNTSSASRFKKSDNNLIKYNTIKLDGIVKDYDLRHEIKFEIIDNYMFAEDQPADMPERHVKSYKTFEYRNEGDCAKMCNLDPTCKSYSYCQFKSENTNNQNNNAQDDEVVVKPKVVPMTTKCSWSTLDLREAEVRSQLVYVKPEKLSKENATISIDGHREGLKYNLKFQDHCNIYERNYLNLFRETDEIYNVKEEVANQFQAASSAFDCARQSVDLELEHKSHHVAMFAYCPTINVCLLDEQLFKQKQEQQQQQQSSESKQLQDLSEDSDSFLQDYKTTLNEVVCRVYRKKYQTYFNVSANVLKLNEHQLEFQFGTVEECARACWIKFGQVCASFDYCSSQDQSSATCLINQIELDSNGKIKGVDRNLLNIQISDSTNTIGYESRQNCLHYERDFVWDKLNLEHSIGKHDIYLGGKINEINQKQSFGSAFGTFITYALSICAFFYGLFVGVRFNDKMEAIKIIRQSFSAEGRRSRQISTSNTNTLAGESANNNKAKKRTLSQSQMFNFRSFVPNGDYLSAEDIYQDEAIINDDDESILTSHSNAIRLDVINKNMD